ncbi:MAG: hypothetical protein OWR52_06730 [Acidibacillus sp.]|uniref:Uncharacterized protein n=1 Tax=Sulfoacidibacillus ferrooxidans TaxID=2005001 RepID=A0A9X1V8C6_9BACL|nr:hypothetical protein [Sulfoacidibacillus ferrooxidans]MCI0183105.1 hypothetical protein [Sulfoacidibacillus ferrooxidans]MCY0893185.1 hypothetical protein [Acidibacillus sp.]
MEINRDDSSQAVESTSMQPVHEDITEGIDRMADEGGGVVDQNFPIGAPILRNNLVRPCSPD